MRQLGGAFRRAGHVAGKRPFFETPRLPLPLDFLTQAERQRYQRLPAAIAERDLRQHFHLSEADRAFVAAFRGATSRLGVALHLGLRRYLGYLPDDWAVHVPAELRAFVTGQLADGALVDLAGYGS